MRNAGIQNTKTELPGKHPNAELLAQIGEEGVKPVQNAVPTLSQHQQPLWKDYPRVCNANLKQGIANKIQSTFETYLEELTSLPTPQPTLQMIKCHFCAIKIQNATEERYGEHLKKEHPQDLEATTHDEGNDVEIGVEGRIKVLWENARPLKPLRTR